jgi:hypothetical protein
MVIVKNTKKLFELHSNYLQIIPIAHFSINFKQQNLRYFEPNCRYTILENNRLQIKRVLYEETNLIHPPLKTKFVFKRFYIIKSNVSRKSI